jgi:hypothetical protein
MARWMVTARGLDRVARPADGGGWGPEGWRYRDGKTASMRVLELVPMALYRVETLGGHGERDSVKAELAVEADDASDAERRAQEVLDEAYWYVEFTSFEATPLTKEHVARHWATRRPNSC